MPSPSLSVLADENIPLVQDAFGDVGTVECRPGRSIRASDLQDTDVLLVRSVTDVGPELLRETPVRFVGSATIGTDHVDQAWLAEAGIPFAHAPASNADSVADYVTSIALRFAVREGEALAERTVGVVGCGNTGSRVARRLEALGARVLRNDPPLAEGAEAHGEVHPYVPLDRMLSEADLLSLHVPLTESGAHPTHHLISKDELARLPGGAWLVNTSRGPVVDGAALLDVLTGQPARLEAVALDVWENEPTPDPALVRAVDLSTPHVAGYAYDGKVRGTTMLYRALCEYLDREPEWTPEDALAPSAPGELQLTPPDPRLPETDYLDAIAQQACDVTGDSGRLRPIVDASDPGAFFSGLRKNYPMRREMQVQWLPESLVPDAYRRRVSEGLCVQLQGEG